MPSTGDNEGDRRSDAESRHVSSLPSRDSNKIQKAAVASLLAGATEAFRTRRKPGVRTKRVLAAAAGAATFDAASNDENEDSSSDDEFTYRRGTGYGPDDTRDTLAHFGGETNPGAKLRGMCLRDIEIWRRSGSYS